AHTVDVPPVPVRSMNCDGSNVCVEAEPIEVTTICLTLVVGFTSPTFTVIPVRSSCGPAKNDPIGPALAAVDASNTDTTGPAPGAPRSPGTASTSVTPSPFTSAIAVRTPPVNDGSNARTLNRCDPSALVTVTRGSPPAGDPCTVIGPGGGGGVVGGGAGLTV